MALIDTYRNNILRKKAEIAKFQKDRANESKKIPSLREKIISANRSISTTKSVSTINSKMREIQNSEKSLASIDKKIAEYDAKIARKEKELADEEKKYRMEEAKEQKKRDDADKKRMRESMQQMKKVEDTLKIQTQMQSQLHEAILDLQSVPDEITVLFMASNPINVAQLRLDEEARSINEMFRKSEHRDCVKFESRWAARPLDLLQAINELNPDIVHFSGHGAESGELVLQNNDGSFKLVSQEAIVQTMRTCSDKIRLVFFNACFSYGQAEAVVEHVEAAIGMNTSIGDDAARVFAAQFYSAIGFGLSVKKAFEQAKAALMLEGIPEENTPELYVKEGLDANDIIIVRP